MKRMKKTWIGSFLLVLLLIVISCNQRVEPGMIPVTTSSDEAFELYEDAFDLMEDVYIDEANKLLDKAIEEDPDFFMANYVKAVNALYFNNKADFKKYSEQALNVDTGLSKGEKLLTEVLVKLKENPGSDVTSILTELTEMYPDDEFGYYQLSMFQGLAGNHKEEMETYSALLEITDNPAPVYNMMGYTYMEMEEMEKAREAFDKYIELAPELPNPYDSKGDYFMATGDYANAYESFMKALEKDDNFAISKEKALKAKKLSDTIVPEKEVSEEL
jgi:hypothetical protein